MRFPLTEGIRTLDWSHCKDEVCDVNFARIGLQIRLNQPSNSNILPYKLDWNHCNYEVRYVSWTTFKKEPLSTPPALTLSDRNHRCFSQFVTTSYAGILPPAPSSFRIRFRASLIYTLGDVKSIGRSFPNEPERAPLSSCAATVGTKGDLQTLHTHFEFPMRKWNNNMQRQYAKRRWNIIRLNGIIQSGQFNAREKPKRTEKETEMEHNQVKRDYSKRTV
ncbi:hypothetical protein QE152_g29810 [Popillia japonica]|uniref:Uncharacterized protein n=1 Tax=Popillia japonica TaxID=7064 RepID=A0AAW1JH59_POPJA